MNAPKNINNHPNQHRMKQFENLIEVFQCYSSSLEKEPYRSNWIELKSKVERNTKMKSRAFLMKLLFLLFPQLFLIIFLIMESLYGQYPDFLLEYWFFRNDSLIVVSFGLIVFMFSLFNLNKMNFFGKVQFTPEIKEYVNTLFPYKEVRIDYNNNYKTNLKKHFLSK